MKRVEGHRMLSRVRKRERDSEYEEYGGNYEKKETANMRNVEKIMRRKRQRI
jgi:hypothetical protein